MASSKSSGAAGGGALYGLGIFGAWVYFWQQADTFWASCPESQVMRRNRRPDSPLAASSSSH